MTHRRTSRVPARPARIPSASRHAALRAAVSRLEPLESRILFAFGVTTGTAPTGQQTYVIDNGGDLVFSVIRGGSVTSTLHLGDVSSIKYKTKEMLAAYSVTGRYSHYEQGLSGSTVITNTVVNNGNANDYIVVKCDDSSIASGAVIQYYIVRRGDNNLYLASLPLDVTNGPGEGRFIAYLNRNVFTTPEDPSDNLGNSGAIEGSDVFGFADGTTSSKFFNMGREMIDNVSHGLTGSATGTPVGAYMFMGNREHSAGGPFFKDIDFQSSTGVIEIYNCIFTGHTQTESYRQGLHTYAMQFTSAVPPTTPDYSFMESLNLQGWIPAAQRGTLTGVATGIPAGHDVVIGLANSSAQYWTRADSGGNYTIPNIQSGTYTATLYMDQLEVGTATVSISAAATTTANLANAYTPPAAGNLLWRIGAWDGTPLGFLNADPSYQGGISKIEIMHPSDSRISPWTSTPNFTIGATTDAQWPAVQFMGVNNAQRITFNLASAPLSSLTLRIGITLGFEGARPRITVNAGQSYAYTSAIPAASRDLNSRGITRGTWRGDNQLYTFTIPASAFRAGTNTIDLPMVSGSYVAGQTWLSPNVVFDALELVSSNAAPTVLAAAAADQTTITTNKVTLSATGADDSLEQNLTYTWSALSIPAGAATPTFSTNNSNAARVSTATVFKEGAYTFRVTITDPSGSSVTSQVTVTFVRTLTGVFVTPGNGSVTSGGTRQFTAVVGDQFGVAMGTQPSFTWSIDSGLGSVSATGLYTAPVLGVSNIATIRATASTGGGGGSNTATATLAADEAAWYRAEQPSTYYRLTDSSAANNPAVLTGNFSFPAGKIGDALSLAGGFATAPDSLLNTASNFTIAAWVKPSSLPAWARVFDFGNSTTDYFFLTLNSSTGRPRFAINDGTGEQIIDSSLPVAANTWIHVAVTLTGSNAVLYINGVAVGSKTNMTLTPALVYGTITANNNLIGDSQFAADPSFQGLIDDFRVYSRAVSPKDIQTLAGAANTAPTISAPAAASQNATANTTAALSVLGNDDTAELNLTYSWAATTLPAGASLPTFSLNNSNAAKSTTATFTKAGTYTLTATITDPWGAATTSQTTLNVTQVTTSFTLSPTSAFIVAGATQQFTATARDQFAQPLTVQPALTWSVQSGFGSINATGLYTAPQTSTTATVKALITDNTSFSATAAITVTNNAPSVVTPASVAVNASNHALATLSVLGDDDAGESHLTYTWSTLAKPPGAPDPAFSPDTSNASKSTTLSLFATGNYTFRVTITDVGNLTTTSDVSLNFNPLPGDANYDGNVDLGDFDIWLANVSNATQAGPIAGDLDFSTIVDLADFDLWLAHVGSTATLASEAPAPPAPPDSSTSVPAAPLAATESVLLAPVASVGTPAAPPIRTVSLALPITAAALPVSRKSPQASLLPAPPVWSRASLKKLTTNSPWLSLLDQPL